MTAVLWECSESPGMRKAEPELLLPPVTDTVWDYSSFRTGHPLGHRVHGEGKHRRPCGLLGAVCSARSARRVQGQEENSFSSAARRFSPSGLFLACFDSSRVYHREPDKKTRRSRLFQGRVCRYCSVVLLNDGRTRFRRRPTSRPGGPRWVYNYGNAAALSGLRGSRLCRAVGRF